MDQIRSSIEPIRKKWVYHFIVSSKTSVIDKPEWYLNQTLKWIHDHIDEVETELSVNFNDPKCNHMKHKFILCMIELAMQRLRKDMGQISSNIDEDVSYEPILIHTYNEVIQFTKTIRRLLGECYRDLGDQHDLLSVFSTQKLFERILDVEWDYAQRNLKQITENTKWDPVLEGEFTDTYRIPRCVDRFNMLIFSITYRLECFQQQDCQFNLIELQCFLLNKFLTFLKNAVESTSDIKSTLTGMLFFEDNSTIDMTRILSITNGANFLRLVLKDKYFIPITVLNDLDPALLDKANKLAQDYKLFFDKLIEKVVIIYEDGNFNLDKFLSFIRPKLCYHIYEIIRDDVSKIHQRRLTQNKLDHLLAVNE